MRIAIIAEVFLPKIDGVVNRTLNLIRCLKRAGDEVMVVCPQARGCSDCSVRVVEVPSFSFPLYPEYRIGLPDQDYSEYLAGEGRELYERCQQEAAANHVFGVPFFIFRGEPFWGHDRLGLLEERLTEAGLALGAAASAA